MRTLTTILEAASSGVFPPEDGGAEVLPPPGQGPEGVVSFTAHAVIANRLARATRGHDDLL